MAALPDSSQIRPKPRNGHLKAGSQRRVSAGHAQPRLLDPDILKEVELPVDEKSKGPTRGLSQSVKVLESLRQGPDQGHYIYTEDSLQALQEIVSRENFSTEVLHEQKVDSTIGEAVLWLKDHDSEESYRLFEEIFVPSPNLGVGKLLDQKDDVYLVKLGPKTVEWIKPRDIGMSTLLSLQSSQNLIRQSRKWGFWVQNPEFRELIERISKAPIGRNLRGNSADFLAGPVNYKSQVTNAASLPLPRAMHKVFTSSMPKKKKLSFGEIPATDPSLWNLSDASLEIFVGQCLSEESVPTGFALGLYQPSNLFLVKIDSSRAEWVRPRSINQRTKLLHDLLEMWNPVIYSSWITLDELSYYFNRFKFMLTEVSDFFGVCDEDRVYVASNLVVVVDELA
ncbi:hypothetical protein PSTG_06797 [Puccinia striiformis f. sp. tritici PST-78]|uniref:Uncharacterized protein n=2 Tax=Puccinia striiformis TaxID=27350 RepID=A0A0L0VLS2_9BASI|nr:hypothetical protein PSTG_06797 [Puccinia striiformis f. sp. tritici PST-78]